jgi:spore coat polysaccharide biosynthesis protein SpsF (cytidylyltransferase family)
VVDEPKDYEMAQTAFAELAKTAPNFRYKDLVELFARRPDILAINSDVKQTPYQPLSSQVA